MVYLRKFGWESSLWRMIRFATQMRTSHLKTEHFSCWLSLPNWSVSSNILISGQWFQGTATIDKCSGEGSPSPVFYHWILLKLPAILANIQWNMLDYGQLACGCFTWIHSALLVLPPTSPKFLVCCNFHDLWDYALVSPAVRSFILYTCQDILCLGGTCGYKPEFLPYWVTQISATVRYLRWLDLASQVCYISESVAEMKSVWVFFPPSISKAHIRLSCKGNGSNTYNRAVI